MAIALTKTLQTIGYNLYITNSIRLLFVPELAIEMIQNVYESEGHYTDEFLPIIYKVVSITDGETVSEILALLGPNYPGAIITAEQYLIDNVGYYTGGSVVA
jgi:hypothetical protein